MNVRLLPELCLRTSEYILCGLIDFVDSFFIINERSSAVARGIKWGIHILFCLLMTPLQLLRPGEDLLYQGLNAISKLRMPDCHRNRENTQDAIPRQDVQNKLHALEIHPRGTYYTQLARVPAPASNPAQQALTSKHSKVARV